MWEWRVWLPLSKETPADVTALLGADIEVEQSDELHYKVSDTSVDLRRVHVKTQKHARAWEGNGSKGESLMLLRVRRGLKWTTCIERWVAISKLSLRDEDFLTEELDDRVMAWLTRNGVNLEHRPQTVAIRRRTLIASLPDERRLSHLLLEQSDLEANGRMWRSVCVRGSSPEQVHRYVLSLREHLLSAGLVASNPVFVRMCLRTESDKIGLSQAGLQEGAPTGGGWAEAEAEEAEAFKATDHESAAFLAKHMSAGLHLEQAWLESNTFSLRQWRQTKWPGWEPPQPPMNLPPSPARPGSGGVVPGVVPGVAREPRYARPDDPQFPREVMRAALGRAAAAGDAPLVSKLLLVRGVDANAHCGLGDTPLHTALHLAAAAGHAECVQALLQRGAHAEALSHGGRSALHEAAGSSSEQGGGAACVRLLLRYGADPRRTDLQGRTALELAREAGRNECAEACATSLHAAWTAQAQPRGRTMGASSTSLPFPSLIYPSADSAVAAEEPSALPLGAQLLRSREELAAELALAL